MSAAIEGVIIMHAQEGTLHCEWYNEGFNKSFAFRDEIRALQEKGIFLKNEFEVIKILGDTLFLHFLLEKNTLFVITYNEAFPKKLGKSLLAEIKTEFESFVQTSCGTSTDPYSYLDTITRPYSQVKFGNLIRSNYQNVGQKL